MKTRAAIAGTITAVGFLGCAYSLLAKEINFFNYSFLLVAVGTTWLALLIDRASKK